VGKKQNLIENNLYNEMWNFAQTSFIDHGMIKREISNYFKNYSLRLPFLFRFVLGCSKIGVQLSSFESKHIALASISKMEKPEGSSYFCDFAFFLRPSADLRAPILDCDAVDPMMGVKGMLEMNLYYCNLADFNIDDFFGESISKIKESLEIIEPYQKTAKQGRGKYTAYLEPYMCNYCIELEQPDAGNVDALKKFYRDELLAFRLYLEAYFSSLLRLKPEKVLLKKIELALIDLFEKLKKMILLQKWGKGFSRMIFENISMKDAGGQVIMVKILLTKKGYEDAVIV
jgi:hypothetical protein